MEEAERPLRVPFKDGACAILANSKERSTENTTSNGSFQCLPSTGKDSLIQLATALSSALPSTDKDSLI
jgi:hypothetical protein